MPNYPLNPVAVKNQEEGEAANRDKQIYMQIKRSGIDDNYKPMEPTKALGAAFDATSDTKYQGSDEGSNLESHEACKHTDYNFYSDDHPTVFHKCIHMDQKGVCTLDECIHDGYETSKLCNKHWDTCIICGRTLTLPPNMMEVPFCDLCRGRFLFAETYKGFECLLCGQFQKRPSKAPFSQICDDCFKNYIYCPNCRHWCQISTSPAVGYDKL